MSWTNYFHPPLHVHGGSAHLLPLLSVKHTCRNWSQSLSIHVPPLQVSKESPSRQQGFSAEGLHDWPGVAEQKSRRRRPGIAMTPAVNTTRRAINRRIRIEYDDGKLARRISWRSIYIPMQLLYPILVFPFNWDIAPGFRNIRRFQYGICLI